MNDINEYISDITQRINGFLPTFINNVKYENYVLIDKDKRILIGIILFDEKYSLIDVSTFYSGLILAKNITSSHKQTEVWSFFIEKLTKLRKKIDIRVLRLSGISSN